MVKVGIVTHSETVFNQRSGKVYIQESRDRGIINVDTMKHEIEQEKQLSEMDDDSGEVNPYRELVVNNAEKLEMQKT